MILRVCFDHIVRDIHKSEFNQKKRKFNYQMSQAEAENKDAPVDAAPAEEAPAEPENGVEE